jgi:hypothetical protein
MAAIAAIPVSQRIGQFDQRTGALKRFLFDRNMLLTIVVVFTESLP